MTNTNVDSDVTVGVKYFDYVAGLSTVDIPRNDDTKPVLNVTMDVTDAKAGDEITISATATDNYEGTITINYEVEFNGEAVEVVNGKFVATEAGVYTVKVTAIDANENKTVYTQNVTVAEAQTSAPSDNTLSAGAIAGIVIGCVAVVAIIVGVVIFVIKKKKK